MADCIKTERDGKIGQVKSRETLDRKAKWVNETGQCVHAKADAIFGSTSFETTKRKKNSYTICLSQATDLLSRLPDQIV